MTRKPRPWEVTASYGVRRDVPHPVVGTMRARSVIVYWRRFAGEPGVAEAEIHVRDRDGLRRRWHLSARENPAYLPDWLRDMVLDCKPAWVDVTGWPL